MFTYHPKQNHPLFGDGRNSRIFDLLDQLLSWYVGKCLIAFPQVFVLAISHFLFQDYI